MVMPSYLTRIFENSVEFQYFQKEFQKDRMVNVSGLTPPLWAALADFVAISNSCPVILVVTEALFSTVYSDCKTASKDRALQFPSWDVLPYEHKYPDSEMVALLLKE
jgi:transcription-repair coupling factor (superfamily II helicase)